MVAHLEGSGQGERRLRAAPFGYLWLTWREFDGTVRSEPFTGILMATPKPNKAQQSRRRKARRVHPRRVLQWVAQQRRAFLALAGLGASGFSDISQEHDKYLHDKP